MKVAPADVRGPDLTRPVRRGLAWWDDGRLYVATGTPHDPVVDVYDAAGPPVQVGRGFRVGPYTVTSCGCSSGWRAVDPAAIQHLAAA